MKKMTTSLLTSQFGKLMKPLLENGMAAWEETAGSLAQIRNIATSTGARSLRKPTTERVGTEHP